MKFEELIKNTNILKLEVEAYVKECEEKSELCQFFGNFLQLVSTIKKAIVADRDGDWPLHVGAVGEALKIYGEFDAYRYLRITSWYYERAKVLEKTHPSLFRRFMMGYFVVRDSPNSVFVAVSPDLKLEQSINRFSNGPGAPAAVGKQGSDAALTEFSLLFHKILSITSLFQSITSPRLMDHSETNIRHDITGKSGLIFDENVKKLFDFVNSRVNPFRIPIAKVPLYNFVTNQMVNAGIAQRILSVQKHGEEVYLKIRQEIFFDRTRKLTDTIHRQNLPSFITENPKGKMQLQSNPVTAKEIATALRNVEIATMRGMSPEEIFSCDLLNSSPLFEGNFTKKPNKAELITKLETYLSVDDKIFINHSALNTHAVIDVMSAARNIPSKEKPVTCGGLVNAILKPTRDYDEYHVELVHLSRDSYIELSLKEGERIRRACSEGTIEVVEMFEDTPIPKQESQFWAASNNKVKLQLLAGEVALRDKSDVLVSAMIVNNELKEAKLKENGTAPRVVPELSSWLEEADSRIIPHVNWSAERGCQRMLVFSNDTDTICLLLRYVSIYQRKGLQELWVSFGRPNRWIPIHKLKTRIGEDLSKNVIKAHILTGCDQISKVGTKNAALFFDPVSSLSIFGESPILSELELTEAEQYLVKCWYGVRSTTAAKTFNELRLQVKTTTVTELHQYPPTSSVIRGHLKRCYYIVRNAITLLGDNLQLDPCDYNWKELDGVMVPEKCLNPLPDGVLKLCGCATMCDSKKCYCKRMDKRCVIYCHKKVINSPCVNKQLN